MCSRQGKWTCSVFQLSQWFVHSTVPFTRDGLSDIQCGLFTSTRYRAVWLDIKSLPSRSCKDISYTGQHCKPWTSSIHWHILRKHYFVPYQNKILLYRLNTFPYLLMVTNFKFTVLMVECAHGICSCPCPVISINWSLKLCVNISQSI